MDLFVVPSRSEGFSLVLQEVARQKKPVVCSDIPIFRELFAQNEVPFFTLEDIDGLVNVIKEAADQQKSYEKKVFDKFLSSYTSVHMAKNYLDIYKNIARQTAK